MAAASTNPRTPHCCRCASGVDCGTETGSSTIRLCTRAHASVRRSSVPTGPVIFHLRISCCELMLTRDMQHVGRGRNRFPAPAAVVPPPIQNYISIDPFSAEQSFPPSFSPSITFSPILTQDAQVGISSYFQLLFPSPFISISLFLKIINKNLHMST